MRIVISIARTDHDWSWQFHLLFSNLKVKINLNKTYVWIDNKSNNYSILKCFLKNFFHINWPVSWTGLNSNSEIQFLDSKQNRLLGLTIIFYISFLVKRTYTTFKGQFLFFLIQSSNLRSNVRHNCNKKPKWNQRIKKDKELFRLKKKKER